MNEIVAEIQRYLRNISRYDNDIPFLLPDGIFGEETTESVKIFQRKHSLEETGRVNFDTWEKLIEENEKAVFFLSQPIATAPAKNEDFPLFPGKESHLNRNLNLMLSHLSAFYKNFDPVEITSDFTSQTQAQLITFQKVADLNQSGQADKETWNLLSELYLLLIPD